MTAHWLTDGQRPSLGEAIAINYGITIPKTLGHPTGPPMCLHPNS